MNHRPPNPFEYCAYAEDSGAHWDEMQEALTAEWLIEQEFMPDPTELDPETNPDTYDECWVLYEFEDRSEEQYE